MRRRRIRLRYKRDADGRFARVNTLVSRAARDALRDKGDKVSLSKANRRNGNDAMPPVDIPEARVSRGNLKYAVDPAKELSGKYDLTGPDLSETNQKAYREAGKIARQLKAKYGDEAPSANLIYRIAKNIQLGTFDPNDPDARKPGEDDSGGKTPRPKPDSDSPKPDRGKRKFGPSEAKTRGRAGIMYEKWPRRPRVGDRVEVPGWYAANKFGDPEMRPGRKGTVVFTGNDSGPISIVWDDQEGGTNFSIGSNVLKFLGDDEPPAPGKGKPEAPKPDAPKKPWREQKAIDELKAAIKDLADVEKKWENSPKSQNSEADREIRAARNRLKNAQAKFMPPFGKYDWPEDVPKGFGLPGTSSAQPKPEAPKRDAKVKVVPMDKFEGLSTKDLIEQYKLADSMGRARVRDRALSFLKARYQLLDEDAKDWFENDPNSPNIPKVSLMELNKRIARAVRLRNSGTTEEKEYYQRQIDQLNANVEERFREMSLTDLMQELKDVQRELTNDRRDAKIYKTRAKQYPDSDSYKTWAENAERKVQVNLGLANRIKARIEELKNGKPKEEDPGAPDPLAGNKVPRNEITSPSPTRINRERIVEGLFSSWISAYRYELDDPALRDDVEGKIREDPEFLEELLARFLEDLKDPSRFDDSRTSYLKSEFTERNGYHDLTPEQRSELADSDLELLRSALDENIIAARIRNDYEDWLQTSESAYDLAVNYNYDDQSLFEIFADGNYDYRSEFLFTDILWKRARKQMRDEGFDGALIAKVPRAAKPQRDDPKKPPIPYRAKNNSISELRRELTSRDKEMIHFVTTTFGDNDFSNFTDEEKERIRQKYKSDTEYNKNLKDKINAMKPDRSRELNEAKDFDELYEIMSNRNPNIKNMIGWHEPDGPLAVAMEEAGVYTDAHRKIILDRVKSIFAAAERMSDEYPEVPFDSLDAQPKSNFSKSHEVIAHCRRHLSIAIQLNTTYIVKSSAAPGGNASGFHPPNFEKDPLANTVIHEFGHSIDWFAFGLHDLVNDFGFLDRQEKNGSKIQRDKMWKAATDEIFGDRDDWLRKLQAQAWRNAKQDGYTGSYADFVQANTSGYARTNWHELIAESWQDYHANGRLASPISIAVSEWVISKYKSRVEEGMKQYDLRSTT